MLSSLAGLGRRTVTGMLSASGQQFSDWTAAYRLFSRERLDAARLAGVIRRGVCDELQPDAPFTCVIDDTLLRKSGRKTPGCAWRRDPMGPKFQTNLVWAQRFFQISAALPAADGPSPARSIPMDFIHAPTPVKPRRDASDEEMAAYHKTRRETRLGLVAVERIASLRGLLDADGSEARALWCVGDGGYTNGTVLKNLPERTVFIGRIRGDAKLHHLPAQQRERGRKKVYGEAAPTPEEFRKDDSAPYQTVEAWAAGKKHQFKIKTIESVRWRKAGERHTLRLIVIAPLRYRLAKGSRALYRKPAHIICTDPRVPPHKVVQAYIWRSGIEVNFKEEKQILGVGQAQVRNDSSVAAVPAFIVAAYAMLHLAARKVFGKAGMDQTLPPPKWRSRQSSGQTLTTSSLIRRLREEMWSSAMGVNFSDFPSLNPSNAKSQKCFPNLASAVLYP